MVQSIKWAVGLLGLGFMYSVQSKVDISLKRTGDAALEHRIAINVDGVDSGILLQPYVVDQNIAKDAVENVFPAIEGNKPRTDIRSATRYGKTGVITSTSGVQALKGGASAWIEIASGAGQPVEEETNTYPIASLEKLLEFVEQDMKLFEATPEMIDRVKHVVSYNIQGGKMNRGLAVVESVELLMGDQCTPEIKEKAIILGWCVEWLQAFFLIADDIMDDSPMRRGNPSWFKNPGIGMIAINDSFIMEALIYRILKRYFRDQPYYLDLLELFLEVSYQTELGQMVDLITAPEDSVDLSRFSLDKHTFIVKYKTAFYSFYLPVALAFHVCGFKSTETDPKKNVFEIAKSILVPMGIYFQVQDDYIDLYGDPSLTGKIGTDIKDNKCSWLIIMALSKASEQQRQLLDTHYGRKSDADEQVVKQIYKELDVNSIFVNYSQKTELELSTLIENTKSFDPKVSAVLNNFFSKISNRKK
ncbi:Farnesyl pyrophosphate synthase [Zancudomyces culisetae]|uniref:Farnesyl pyrophosphate synthase n=1 Tax=Zancudomyces culisetae TaxID=1213189 RepID=A0A1R1PIE6_ZANCU|nr:Farnesyl pyrophosphate synthase [Zancudomyces culisetae]OMH80888.1 Farnesyl pyrophosphate synthase [Zancudomyces culisetae]|eukprot:OMH80699.1 Farnesyl pyrophosphate synthase [Zancudomyces culisetae]